MRGLIYVRVSTARQEAEGYSLEAQLAMCRDYAARACIEVLEADEYVEVESASSTGRPRFAAMLEQLRRRPGLVVIAQSADRLHRNMEDSLELEAAGAQVHLVHEGGPAPAGAMGRFTGRLKAALAALYTDRLSEEVRKGMGAKAARGLWPTRAPIGYRNLVESGQRVIEPHPELGPLVRQLFVRCAGGENLDALAAWAAGVGLRRPGAKAALSRSRIAEILAHRVYHGAVVWGDQVAAGLHQPLVTEAEWQAARDALHGRRRCPRGAGRPRRFHAYGGLLFRCTVCGCSVVGETRTQRHGHVYTYYVCSGQRGACPRRRLREEVLEAGIQEELRRLQMDDEAMEWWRGVIADLARDDGAARREERARVRREIEVLEGRLDRSLAAYTDGLVDAGTHRRMAEGWWADKARAQGRLGDLDRVERVDVDLAMGILEVAQGSSRVLPDLAPEARRELVAFFAPIWLLEPDTGLVRAEWSPPWGWWSEPGKTLMGSGMAPVPTDDGAVWRSEADQARTPILQLVRLKPGPWYPQVLAEVRRAA